MTSRASSYSWLVSDMSASLTTPDTYQPEAATSMRPADAAACKAA
jgi:hypothetical protein